MAHGEKLTFWPKIALQWEMRDDDYGQMDTDDLVVHTKMPNTVDN
jgi:hypothetical protein